MNKKTKKQVIAKLEKELEKKYLVLASIDQSKQTDMFEQVMEDIDRLEDAIVTVKGKANGTKKDIDWNMIIQAGVGLTSILLILNYEKTEILTSKALPFAQKLIGR